MGCTDVPYLNARPVSSALTRHLCSLRFRSAVYPPKPAGQIQATTYHFK